MVFGNGVAALTVFSAVLIVAVGGNTNTLIPLFAIGVFIGFTLSQAGLVMHWRNSRPPGWARRAAINGTGAVVTATATVIFLFTKFLEGAWVVVVAVPLIIVLFNRVEKYYTYADKELGIGVVPAPPERKRTLVIVPVTDISRLTQHALSEAVSLSEDVMAVTVEFEGEPTDPPRTDMERRWQRMEPRRPAARPEDGLRLDRPAHPQTGGRAPEGRRPPTCRAHPGGDTRAIEVSGPPQSGGSPARRRAATPARCHRGPGTHAHPRRLTVSRRKRAGQTPR